MSGDLDPIERVAGALLRQLAPAQRRALLRRMARDIRASQAARIGRQEDPEGRRFAPRKKRDTQADKGRFRRAGSIRRGAMFRKLRMNNRNGLQSGVTDREAWIGFTGRAARIAAVHQSGGMDRPAPGVRAVRYAERGLIGLTAAERTRALDLLLDTVAAAVGPA